MTVSRIPYPWVSLIVAIGLIFWQLIMAHPEWIEPYVIWPEMERLDYLLAALGLWLLLLVVELFLFYRARSGYRKALAQHEDQIAELFESRRELGTRVRTYSSHADKLKLFISDKLLEYLEYDEKFLHFKNIASEVRHNGVISYDRVQTALRQAAEVCAGQLDEKGQVYPFREASESLLYLWDLLDIATTDNISLHVANRIYDCEEYYFQSQLKKDDDEALPYSPTFSMASALQKALMPVVEDPLAFGSAFTDQFPVSYIDRRFELKISANTDLLGNRNHMVLLLENLLNNALYYAEQSSSKTRYHRVRISLALYFDEVVLQVYNRGPRIKEEDRDRVFQLGYSSRRIREHHGKGLGLYFVNEICKGFEGSIGFENEENRDQQFTLVVSLTGGEQETRLVSIVAEGGKALCIGEDSDAAARRSHEWGFSNPIQSITVISANDRDEQVFEGIKGESSNYQDGEQAMLPRWAIDIHNRRRSTRLVFKPVDVRGVRFKVRLPTALSRLELE